LAGVFPTGGTIPGRASVISMDGWTWEEMAVEPHAGLVLAWPQMRPVRSRWVRSSEAEQRDRTRERLDRINEIFDAAAAYIAAKDADPDLPTDIRWEAMRPLFAPATPSQAGRVDGQKPVFIHAQEA